MATMFTTILNPLQAEKLRLCLEDNGAYVPATRDYASYCYEGPQISVAYYPKKGKLLAQGKGVDEFVEFLLEPKITGFANTIISEAKAQENAREAKAKERERHAEARVPSGLDTSPHFGIDESGKGDYFGPLVVAGVYCSGESARALAKLGCCDSKLIKNEAKIQQLAKQIMATPGTAHEVICMGPARYNEIYAEMGNLNRLLAWGHARVIASLHEQVPDCPRALSDQFANEWVLKRALGQRKIPIELEQRTKGESDIAVAAASILARARFVRWMREAAVAAGMDLPLGCAPHVVKAARAFYQKYGEAKLAEVAKLHFKVTKQIM